MHVFETVGDVDGEDGGYEGSGCKGYNDSVDHDLHNDRFVLEGVQTDGHLTSHRPKGGYND